MTGFPHWSSNTSKMTEPLQLSVEGWAPPGPHRTKETETRKRCFQNGGVMSQERKEQGGRVSEGTEKENKE